MKKLIPIALTLAMALTACGQTAQTTPAPAPTDTPAAVEALAATPTPKATPELTPAATAEPAPAAQDSALPEACPLLLIFSSGAGGWSTELMLEADGSFSGNYHDSDMGSTGEGYPGGTFYYSNFYGSFTDIKRLEDGSWSLTLDEIHTEVEPGQEEIRQEGYNGEQIGVLFISADPYGLEAGKDFILYPPETPVEGLDEEFLSWWPGRFEDPKPTTLGSYGLWNRATGYGFFGDRL